MALALVLLFIGQLLLLQDPLCGEFQDLVSTGRMFQGSHTTLVGCDIIMSVHGVQGQWLLLQMLSLCIVLLLLQLPKETSRALVVRSVGRGRRGADIFIPRLL